MFSYFAPTILRVTLALLFFYLAARTWQRARHLGNVRLPLIGAHAWLPYLAGAVEAVVAVMFLVGWYTQLAALLSILGMIKYAAYEHWSPEVQKEYIPFSPTVAFLVAMISISLLFSGAGAFAFDIPL